MSVRWINVRLGLRRARGGLVDALRALVFGSPIPRDAKPLFECSPGPSHPSLFCKCPGGEDAEVHLEGCAWVAARCTTCNGNGWCASCLGDGIQPERRT